MDGPGVVYRWLHSFSKAVGAWLAILRRYRLHVLLAVGVMVGGFALALLSEPLGSLLGSFGSFVVALHMTVLDRARQGEELEDVRSDHAKQLADAARDADDARLRADGALDAVERVITFSQWYVSCIENIGKLLRTSDQEARAVWGELRRAPLTVIQIAYPGPNIRGSVFKVGLEQGNLLCETGDCTWPAQAPRTKFALGGGRGRARQEEQRRMLDEGVPMFFPSLKDHAPNTWDPRKHSRYKGFITVRVAAPSGDKATRLYGCLSVDSWTDYELTELDQTLMQVTAAIAGLSCAVAESRGIDVAGVDVPITKSTLESARTRAAEVAPTTVHLDEPAIPTGSEAEEHQVVLPGVSSGLIPGMRWVDFPGEEEAD